MTESTNSQSTEEPSPGAADRRPDEGLSYLIGESIFLRGLEADDAKWAMAWRKSPFPISAQELEEQLKKSVPEQAGQRRSRLIACRRDDGRPVGSARVDDHEHTESWLSLHADPALGSAGEQVQAEMLGLLVPWLADERLRPIVNLETDADSRVVIAKAEAMGMRPAVRLRDGVWRDGRLHDLMIYDYPNPIWVARLGDPGAGIEDAGEPVLAPRSPAPRREPTATLALPPNAILGSERLALRPMQAEDAARIASMTRADPDASFGHSRYPLSPLALGGWIGEMGKQTPATDLELAVVLRESGDLIGEVGLYTIDWLARTAESATWIYRPDYRGGGYGTEAKHLLLEYAFDRLGLNMIWSWVKSRNPRSQAALRKQGYRDAGRNNWVGYGPDGFENAQLFDLLADEWRSARATGDR